MKKLAIGFMVIAGGITRFLVWLIPVAACVSIAIYGHIWCSNRTDRIIQKDTEYNNQLAKDKKNVVEIEKSISSITKETMAELISRKEKLDVEYNRKLDSLTQKAYHKYGVTSEYIETIKSKEKVNNKDDLFILFLLVDGVAICLIIFGVNDDFTTSRLLDWYDEKFNRWQEYRDDKQKLKDERKQFEAEKKEFEKEKKKILAKKDPGERLLEQIELNNKHNEELIEQYKKEVTKSNTKKNENT